MEARKEKLIVPNINDIPDKILVLIFKHLQFTDRLRVTIVCRRWNQLVLDFFGKTIKMRLRDGMDLPIGWLSDRVYQNMQAFWEKGELGWMFNFEYQAGKANSTVVPKTMKQICFDLYIMEEMRNMKYPLLNPWENLLWSTWNPPRSLIQRLTRTLDNLKVLCSFSLITTSTTFLAILEEKFDLTYITDFKVNIRIDDGSFGLSCLNGLCRLPVIRSVSISSYIRFRTSDEDDLVPTPFVKSLTLEQYSPCSGMLKFCKLFPCLTQLEIQHVKFTSDELQHFVTALPALEVLVLGLQPTIMNSTSLEILLQLPKLRKLSLLTLYNYAGKGRHFANIERTNFALLKTIFRISTLEELHLADGLLKFRIDWAGQIPTDAPSCRLYINGKLVPRTSSEEVKTWQLNHDESHL